MDGQTTSSGTSTIGRSQMASEWRNGWPVVLAGFFGYILLSLGSLSMGAFMLPMERAFHWTRSEYSIGLSAYAIVGVIFSPLVGYLVDKWGVRAVAVMGSMLTGVAFSLFATSNGSIAYWFALWLVLGMANQLIMPTVWSAAVSGIFTASRGFALSLVTVGSAVAAFIAPATAAFLIERYEWRVTYVTMGFGGGALVSLICWLALSRRIRRSELPHAGSTSAIKEPQPGLTFGEGLRSSSFLKIAVIAFVSYGLVIALSLHLIQIFAEAGMNREMAVVIAGSYGLPMLAGRLIGGLALDRISGQLVAATCIALLAVSSLVLILAPQQLIGAIVAVALFGFAFGGISPTLPYLASRYFGLRSYGKLFGVLNAVYSLATATCPLLASWIYDLTGSYFWFLLGALPALLMAMGLVLSLGRYPDFADSSN